MTFFSKLIFSSLLYLRCAHKLEALKATEMATQHQIDQSSLEELNDAQKHMIKQKYGDNNLVVYSLPGENICVPTIISEDSGDSFTHVKSGKVSFIHMKILLLGFFDYIFSCDSSSRSPPVPLCVRLSICSSVRTHYVFLSPACNVVSAM